MNFLKVALTFWIVCVLTTFLSAQIKTESFAIGFGGGGILGDTDFGRDDKIGPEAVGWLRHALIGPLEGQITGHALGELQRDDNRKYRTRIYSGDYRLLIRPFSGTVFSPYLYGGIGGLFYDVKEQPVNANPALNTDGWEAYSPVGGGFQLGLSEYISLDFSGGYNFVFTDALNLVDANGNDAYFNAAAGLTIKLQSGLSDSDGDGISDKEEKRLGTNKHLKDSDTDGLGDGDEIYQYRTHPLRIDTDNDGLNDREEVVDYLTDPRNRDSDGDGLSDSEEVFNYRTSPLKKDSDGDRLSDKDEVSVTRTNPNNMDTDDDGLDDGVEVATYKSDPLKADTDGDGLSDKEEAETTHTNPLFADSDDDGLNDGKEVLSYQTDPLIADTDGGGVADGEEVKLNLDPLDPKDDDKLFKIGDIGDKIVLEGILFATNSARISSQSRDILEKAYQTMLAYPDIVVEIRGFTDNTGSYTYNLTLSQKRAEAVRRYLIELGINPGRLIAKGFGEENPIASNRSAAGRAQNRRIEFVRIQ